MLNRIAVAGLILATLAMPGAAQIAESLRSQYHKEDELGIRVVEGANVGDVQRYVHDPDTRVIALQSMVEEVPEATAVALVDWVRQGKTLWLYDSRLAEKYFGFKDYKLSKEQFRGKPESGKLGGRGYDGLATVGLAFGSHPMVTGVGEATVFLPLLKDPEGERYPAVMVEADTVPLLRFAHDSPALCAVRHEGRGMIVFKPLMWTLAYSGERLQCNILEFSAGYEVPGMGGYDKVGNPPGPKHDFVTGNPATPVVGSGGRIRATPMPVATATATPAPLAVASAGVDRVSVGGETVEGVVLTPEFRFETGGNSLMLKKQEIKRLDIGGQLDLDRLTTAKGDTYKGLLMTRKIEVQDKDGTRTLEKAEITSIEFASP